MVELDRKAANRASHERRRRLAGARPQAASLSLKTLLPISSPSCFRRFGVFRDERAVVDIRRHPKPAAAIRAIVGQLSFCCHPHIERKPS